MPNEPDPTGSITTCETIDASAQRAQRLAPRRRRIVRALFDLGLIEVVGADWTSVVDAGLEFATLSEEVADRLACRLEDLAAGIANPPPCPGRGQLGLDFDPVEAPAPLFVGPGLHPAVFR